MALHHSLKVSPGGKDKFVSMNIVGTVVTVAGAGTAWMPTLWGNYTVSVSRDTSESATQRCQKQKTYLTSCCVHLDLLASLDADTFLLALRRFIAWRGTLLSDQGLISKGLTERRVVPHKKMLAPLGTIPETSSACSSCPTEVAAPHRWPGSGHSCHDYRSQAFESTVANWDSHQVIKSSDGCIWSAEIRIRGKTCLQPVACLVASCHPRKQWN